MSIPRMNYPQYRKARKLTHECCNYCDGNCLLLDDGEECVCVQSISYSLLCRWFRAAVLPLDGALYAEIMARVRKCPAMPYLVVATLPMLPGAGVYYTMSLGLEGDMMEAVAKGLETVGIAGSLAVGILLVSTVFRLVNRRRA